MEHLISTTLELVTGNIEYSTIQTSVNLDFNHTGRVTKVFLHCNESYSSPIATTNGDLNVTDHYVSQINIQLKCLSVNLSVCWK